MEANVLQFLTPKIPVTSTILGLTRPSSTIPPTTLILSPRRHWSLRIHATNSDSTSNSNSNSNSNELPPPITPIDTAGIRFRRGSRRRARIEQDGAIDGEPRKAVTNKQPPKKWEDMTFQEKALELYVGEKGALFWLNKFAYASIYIIIGAWILFRFVGPALNLYQLDTPLLSPSDVLKGS